MIDIRDVLAFGESMTAAEATEIAAEALDAYRKALKAYSYSVSSGGTSRNMTRQKLTDLWMEYQRLQLIADELSGTRTRIRFITHRD